MDDEYEEVGRTETKETELDFKLIRIRKGTQTHLKKKPAPERLEPTKRGRFFSRKMPKGRLGA